MMKILKNERLARWVIGIVVVGLIMAYVPLLFVPQQASAPQPAPNAQQPAEPPTASTSAPNPPVEIVTSTVGIETSVSSSATGTPR